MSAGGLYIWLMSGCFLLVAVVIAVFAAVLYIGHRAEKRRTGSKAGFLEYQPPQARSDLPKDV